MPANEVRSRGEDVAVLDGRLGLGVVLCAFCAEGERRILL